MTLDVWLDGVNIDLTLLETRDAPDEPWPRRALAGASVGVDPKEAYEAALELVEAIGLIVEGNSEGKARLAAILGKPCNDYQRNLWYAVAGRGTVTVAADLRWLLSVLASRTQHWFGRRGWGRSVSKQPDPYLTDQPEGPLGCFPASFELGAHWNGATDKC